MHPQQHTPRLSGSEVEICTLPVGTQNKTGSGELGNLSQERCYNSLQSLQLSLSPRGESSVSERCLSLFSSQPELRGRHRKKETKGCSTFCQLSWSPKERLEHILLGFRVHINIPCVVS